jgi:hypothetical protein
MKRIMNGMTYNTATATRLARAEYECDDPRPGEVHATLYQTRGGAFFLHEEITEEVWNEAARERQKRLRNVLEPLSSEDAQKWLLDGDVEIFNNPFDDPPEATAEAEPGATIYIRVPISLKRQVDEAAREAAVSGNVWAMRCLETCAGEWENVKRALANAHYLMLGLRAHEEGAYSYSQIQMMADDVVEEIEDAWLKLGFRDPRGHSDLGTQITNFADVTALGDGKYPPYTATEEAS